MKVNNILVTGSHRSGSTWVGKMLALSERSFYLDEPFNLKYKQSPFKYWFEYVDKDNLSDYYAYLGAEVKPSLKSYYKNIQKAQNRPELKYRLLQNLSLAKGDRMIFKDPIAVLSTATIVKEFHLNPVVLMRHPLAVVSSIQTQKWTHDFSAFLEQPSLMEHWFGDYEREIVDFVEHERTPLEQNAFLWVLLNSAIVKYKAQFDNWYFVKYETLAQAPVDEFRKMYNHLGMDYTEGVEANIREHCSPSNAQESSAKDPHTVSRYSAGNIDLWRQKMSQSEINSVWQITEQVATALGYTI